MAKIGQIRGVQLFFHLFRRELDSLPTDMGIQSWLSRIPALVPIKSSFICGHMLGSCGWLHDEESEPNLPTPECSARLVDTD